MNVNKATVILTFGVASVISGIWLVISPGTFPLLGLVEPMGDRDSATTIATLLALVVIVVAVWRVWRGADVLDRSPISETPPEAVSAGAGRPASEPLDVTYNGLQTRFDNPGQVERHVAMYGRRASHTVGASGELGSFLDELAVTVREVHITATGCSIETAEKAVATGTWTDDRIAAAFLASDLEAPPAFTPVERLIAWLMPRRTFERRVKRVLDTIEGDASVYLTYDATPTSTNSIHNEF